MGSLCSRDFFECSQRVNKRALNAFHGELIDVRFPKDFFNIVVVDRCTTTQSLKLLNEKENRWKVSMVS